MFEGCRLDFVDVGDVTLRVRTGGDGPPLLLLHGHPQTHAMWNRVAPMLAERHTLVMPDLTGYGESSKPATTADHRPYSKRAMASDVVRLMDGLGMFFSGITISCPASYAAVHEVDVLSIRSRWSRQTNLR